MKKTANGGLCPQVATFDPPAYASFGWNMFGRCHFTQILRVMRSNVARSHRTNEKIFFLAMKAAINGFDLTNKRILFMQIRLTIILLTVALVSARATVTAQNVSLSGKNLSLKHVFTEIKKQTGYVILYNDGLLADTKPVTLSVSDLPVSDLLNLVLKDQAIKYTIQGKTIFLSSKPSSPPPFASSDIVKTALPPPLTGRVTDTTGKPLQGVSVVASRDGRLIGVAKTDENGEFYINTEVKIGDMMSFSSIGFESRNIPAGAGDAYMYVVLRQVAKDLSTIEVTSVNTGYQRIRPEQSTGAVSSINTKQYESRVNTDFLSGLVNKLPGLMINTDIRFNNSFTSSNTLFNVRGISTISGNQSPLIVIDGYPTELSLSMINPNEIESVTVLKDAAAATVYGVRASNGVIIVERKQAVSGKARFNFRATTGITPKDNYSRYRWDPHSSRTSVEYTRHIYANSVNENSWKALLNPNNPRYPPAYYPMALLAANVISADQADAKFEELSAYNNAEEYRRLFLRTAVTQSYNLNLSGGTPGALYYITANYTGNKAQQIKSNSGQFQLSGRSTLNLSKRLSLELTLDYQESQSRRGQVPSLSSMYPYERLQDEFGAPLPVAPSSIINPYYNDVLMSQGFLDHLSYPLMDVDEITDKARGSNNRITGNFIYKLGGGFNLRFGGIYENAKSDSRHYATAKSTQARQYVNSYSVVDASGNMQYNIPRGGFLQQQTGSTTGYTVRAQLNYDRQLGKNHSLNGIIGAEVRDVVNQGTSAAYFGYDDQTLLQQPVNYTLVSSNFINPLVPPSSINYNSLFNQRYTDDRYVSGYSNIVYAFRNTYSLSASVRIDQSNLFGTDPRYRYKPLWSVGAAWNVHQEEFMQNLTWVKQLKLRVAEGFNGNVAKMSLPRVIGRSLINTNTAPASTALTRQSFANSGLRWEQTNNFNVGLDFSIFKGISGTFEYYNKRSTDLLANTQIDPTIGRGPTYINTASINNQGLELNLQADWISKPRFNWNTGLVAAWNRSKTLRVYQNVGHYPIILNSTGYLEGYPLGVMFSYRWAGLDNAGVPQVMDDKGKVYSSAAPDVQAMMTTGGLTSGLVQYMGTSIPPVNAGLSNRVDVGNFYFYCMINYYGRFKVLTPRPNPIDRRPLAGAADYWKQQGDELETDVMSLTAFNSLYPRYAYEYADVYVVNGDYLTLGDVTVSYNLGNNRAFKKAGFSLFEIKLQASNVYTIGLNKFNYSLATGSYEKSYVTPTYTIALFTNF